MLGLDFRLSSLSDPTVRFLELAATEGNDSGESSTSIPLTGVVGTDGLLKREVLVVEGVSDCGGERNPALLRGGMDTRKAAARRRAVKGTEKGRGEGSASRSLTGNNKDKYPPQSR